jgi:hypothetical protein
LFNDLRKDLSAAQSSLRWLDPLTVPTKDKYLNQSKAVKIFLITHNTHRQKQVFLSLSQPSLYYKEIILAISSEEVSTCVPSRQKGKFHFQQLSAKEEEEKVLFV